MSSTLSGPSMPPAKGEADSLVVLVHGYGADGNDLIGLAPYWQPALPTTAFVAPNAPEPCAAQPMGYQWFGITRLDPGEMKRGVEKAAPLLDAFIDAELERRNVDPSRLVLVGFSQGTMMSLQVGLRRKTPPAAILGYSGALAGGETLQEEMTGKPPILLIHGDQDPMIPVGRMLEAANTLGEAGLAVQWHVSRGIGHSIDPEGLELGGAFIRDALAGKLKSGEAAGMAAR